MFRNQYDSDNSTWSPQGRLFQVEYAMEAIKQGSAVVGLKSKTHVVLLSFNRQINELGSYQKKIFEIDEHIGVGVSGFCSDARSLTRYMRDECIDYTYIYGSQHPVEKIVSKISSKAQKNTQHYGNRPYGVGLLVAGYDTKTRLFETCPSGNYYDYKAQALGARSQSCKTYLEKHFEKFEELPLDELIIHGIKALSESLHTTKDELSSKNCTIAIVGKDTPFKFLNDNEINEFIENSKKPVVMEVELD